MSESINARTSRDFRRQLLTSVSAAVLLASVYGARNAEASDGDSDRPPLWIELGGQLEAVTGQGQEFNPPFFSVNTDSPVFKPVSPFDVEKPSRFSYGAEAAISFEPEGTNWIFSGALRYGRSRGNKHTHVQDPKIVPPIFYTAPVTLAISAYADTKASNEETHAIADFQVGRDVGLGMFGRASTSSFGLGVRFAQFSSKSTVTIDARPYLDVVYQNHFGHNIPIKYYRSYQGYAHAERNFHGVGPSISWSASVPVAGNPQESEIALDWGLNAAVLFGRQRTKTSHQTTAHENAWRKYNTTLYQHPLQHQTRQKSVTVPNLGGFAGLSFRYSDAKVSFGYRADFFFGAMDGGMDTAKQTTAGFQGPYATISVGIGG